MTTVDTGNPRTGTHGHSPYSAPQGDARELQQVLLRSVFISPNAFLATFEEIRDRRPPYWENELRESTWAIVQKEGTAVGVAASKRPYGDRVAEYELSARFIESVWIDPSMRRNGLGGRLVKYLIERERAKDPEIQQFYLSVFRDNIPAIALYEQMGFKPTGRRSWPRGHIEEVEYKLMFDSPESGNDELAADADRRGQDLRDYGLRYRVLGR